MTTEELADCLGVAKQTVNRWIREQNWTTEKFPGVKGGRARLIHIDSSVRTFLLNIPAFRKVPEIYQAEEPLAEYNWKTCPQRNKKSWQCIFLAKVFALSLPVWVLMSLNNRQKKRQDALLPLFHRSTDLTAGFHAQQ